MNDDFSAPPLKPRNPYEPPISGPAKGATSSQRREGVILGLGIAGIATTVVGAFMGFLCCLFWPIAAVGLVMGGVAAVLGYTDLKAIAEGRLDPDAHGQTQLGMILGLVGLGLGVLMIVGMIALLIGIGISNAAR